MSSLEYKTHLFLVSIIMYVIQNIATIFLTNKITWKKEMTIRNAYSLNIHLDSEENLGDLFNHALQFFFSSTNWHTLGL